MKKKNTPVVSEEKIKSEKKIDVKVEIRKLLKRGREQGFIAQEDVLAIFPQPENAISEIDDLYHKCLDEGIDVFDTTEFDVWRRRLPPLTKWVT